MEEINNILTYIFIGTVLPGIVFLLVSLLLNYSRDIRKHSKGAEKLKTKQPAHS